MDQFFTQRLYPNSTRTQYFPHYIINFVLKFLFLSSSIRYETSVLVDDVCVTVTPNPATLRILKMPTNYFVGVSIIRAEHNVNGAVLVLSRKLGDSRKPTIPLRVNVSNFR